MKRKHALLGGFAVLLCAGVVSSCSSKAQEDQNAMAPPTAKVTEEPDLNIVKVERPERFVLVTAGEQEEQPQSHAVGTITPDVDQSVPVLSLASGRVVGIYAKLGDDVRKGQLLLKVLSNDISTAFQTYRQAKADEALAKTQLERAQLLYEHGAISLNDLQVAQDSEAKSQVAVETAAQQVHTLGGNVDNPDSVVSVFAPVSGTIVEQNVVNSSVVHTPDNQQNLFTIANLATVWAICNVYENDLPNLRLGDSADVELNAYPGRIFHGRISNIGKVLDANARTTPVRIDLKNPGIMRSGMFVTATFYGQKGHAYAFVPSGAVLHLHDRDWVFVPNGKEQFRRTEVMAGKIIDGRQQILSGIGPGQQVVRDALALSAESEQ